MNADSQSRESELLLMLETDSGMVELLRLYGIALGTPKGQLPPVVLFADMVPVILAKEFPGA